MSTPDSTAPGRRPLLRVLEPLLWVAVALVLLARFGPQLQAWTGIGPPSAGEAPEFSVAALDGTVLRPEEVRGKVQVITFWATWCTACRFELPAVQRVHEEWADSGDVQVLGLSIDRAGAAVVQAHGQEKGLTFPLAMADPSLRQAFGGVRAVPTTIVVDRSGKIRHTMVGVSGPGTLQRAVRRLVQEEPPPP